MNNLAKSEVSSVQDEIYSHDIKQVNILYCGQKQMKNGKLYLFTKRIIDLVGALIGILVFSPVFLVVAISIKFEDFGTNVIYSQKRIGLNGKKFKMYKFRSMVVNAEEKLDELLEHNEIEGAMFKMKEDPRITKVGKFIRRTSLDELPQLINVVRGEMSLVGPRPPLSREVEQYTPNELQRLKIVPGCTGLWQVSGRSSLDFCEMIELDLEYAENRSLLFDIKIILKTIPVMLSAKNSY